MNRERRKVLVSRGEADCSVLREAQEMLSSVRKQYDEVHVVVERKTVLLTNVREDLRVLGIAKGNAMLELRSLQDEQTRVAAQVEAQAEKMAQVKIHKRVLEYMTNRMQSDKDALKKNIIELEDLLSKRNTKLRDVTAADHRQKEVNIKIQQRLTEESRKAGEEKMEKIQNLSNLQKALETRTQNFSNKKNFKHWRNGLEISAAAEALDEHTRKLRKHYTVEKLISFHLGKKLAHENLTLSSLSAKFHRISDVTGFVDVQKIVYKFLHRDEERLQLLATVKSYEKNLAAVKSHTGIASRGGFVHMKEYYASSKRALYLDIEKTDDELKKRQSHKTETLEALRNCALQNEQILRWVKRLNRFLPFTEQDVANIPIQNYLTHFLQLFKRYFHT